MSIISMASGGGMKIQVVLMRALMLPLCLLFLVGCTSADKDFLARYPKKPADNPERKAGRAMLFYEQAEKDMDINTSVIVVQPPEKAVQ